MRAHDCAFLTLSNLSKQAKKALFNILFRIWSTCYMRNLLAQSSPDITGSDCLVPTYDFVYLTSDRSQFGPFRKKKSIKKKKSGCFLFRYQNDWVNIFSQNIKLRDERNVTASYESLFDTLELKASHDTRRGLTFCAIFFSLSPPPMR